jgi:multiple sugar transport system ATP-binding protein
MAAISLNNIRKSYGTIAVVHGIDLEVFDGEFLVLVGPSGCGKSTLLRMIAGLEEITDGTLTIGGRVVNGLAPAERDVAMVFQDYALYPHMTVAENMGFGLAMRDHPSSEIQHAVRRAAEVLKVGALLDRRPAQLSGGQRQRVAMGRAIVREPQVFLFDEPLSNLDSALRGEMRIEIARLHRSMSAPTVYVTHDQIEAMTLADRIVVMNRGRIEQVGAPMELYLRPKTLFVARFIGAPTMNTLAPEHCGALPNVQAVQGLATVGIRPEDLHPADGAATAFSGEVAVVERLGSQTFVHVDIGADRLLTAEWPRAKDVQTGELVALTADADKLHFFDHTGARLWSESASR